MKGRGFSLLLTIALVACARTVLRLPAGDAGVVDAGDAGDGGFDAGDAGPDAGPVLDAGDAGDAGSDGGDVGDAGDGGIDAGDAGPDASAGGRLDPSFGDAGFITIHNVAGGGGDDWGFAIARDSVNRVYVTGPSLGPISRDLGLVRLTAAGVLDPAFGVGGKVSHANAAGGGDSWNDYSYAVIVDDSDRPIVGGYSHNGTNYDFVIWRFNTNGTLDMSFGDAGFAVWNANLAGTTSADFVYALLRDPATGQIVAAGTSNTIDGGFDGIVFRFNSDGTRDTRWNNDAGYTLLRATDGKDHDEVRAIGFHADGGIVAWGRLFVDAGGIDAVGAWCLNSNGTVDSTWNGGQGFFRWMGNDAGNVAQGWGMAVVASGAESGKIVGAGRTNGRGFVLRLNANGTLDTTFGGGNGFVTWVNPGGGSAAFFDVRVTPSEKYVVTGVVHTVTDDMVVARFGRDGVIDPTFGADGGGFLIHGNAADGGDSGRRLVIDSEGRILVGGFSLGAGGTGYDVAVWRLTP